MNLYGIKKYLSLCLIGILCACQLSGCGYYREDAPVQTEISDIDITNEQEILDEKEEAEESVSYERPVSKPNVLVDQSGYQTDDTKKVLFLGENLSDSFSVVEYQTGEVIYTGNITAKGYDEETDTYVSVGDFSEVKKNGDYYIETEIIGRSYPFSIGKNPYEDQYDSLIRELMELDFSEDCADVKAVAETVSNLLFTYEFFVQNTDKSGEGSQNQMPQLLELAQKGCDALLACQNETDGSISEGINKTSEVKADLETCYTYVAAMAGCGYAFKQYDANLSRQYIKAAEKTYTYCEKNGQDSEGLYYAEAQLYRATGTKRYHDKIKSYLEMQKQLTVSENDISGQRLYGDVVYLSTDAKVDQDICTELMNNLLNRAEVLAAQAEKDYYLVCADEKRDINTIMNNMFLFAVVDHVIVSHEYLVILKEQLHYLNGRNSDCAVEYYSAATKSALLFILGDMLHREENIE